MDLDDGILFLGHRPRSRRMCGIMGMRDLDHAHRMLVLLIFHELARHELGNDEQRHEQVQPACDLVVMHAILS